MAGSNLRTGYLDLGPSKSGFSGGPLIANAATSDLILNNAPLFGCSSAFFCKTKTATLAGNTISLWNGNDETDTTWSAGEARITPNPPIPADVTYSNVILIVTPFTGPHYLDYWELEPLGGAGMFSTFLKIKWLKKDPVTPTDPGVALTDRQVWFSCMVISPRRGANNSTYPLAEQWAKQALSGGEPSAPGSVHPV